MAGLEWISEDYVSILEEEGLDTISVDKMSLADRTQWTIYHMDMLIEIANTQDIKRLIEMDAEKPISAMACCIEWANIWAAADQGLDHVSYLPIPVDGSTNGAQHYAATSHDENAADFTGLVETAIPVDFYVRVGKALMAEMPDWFAERKIPMKVVRKGISKRACMSRLYSAGAAKIAENMYSDLHKDGYDIKYLSLIHI